VSEQLLQFNTILTGNRPELIHPFASAIDTELEIPKTMVRVPNLHHFDCNGLRNYQVIVKNNSKPEYVRLPEGKKEVYEDYGNFSIEEWHKKHSVFKA